MIKMKNPYECDDIDELRDICLYWMQKANMYHDEIRVLMELLMQNNINPSIEEIIYRTNDYISRKEKQENHS